MEELKDKSLHLTAEKLAEELQKMDIYNEFYEDLQVLYKIFMYLHFKNVC